MKIGLTGGRGKLARYLLARNCIDLDCDVRDVDDIRSSLDLYTPDIILHCAARSDVEWCEKHQGEAIEVNVRGTFNVAEQALRLEIPVVLVSSSHVFSGNRWWGKYSEKESPNPKNFYGHTKMAAEALVSAFPNLKVVRTSYLFDYPRLANNFEYHHGIFPTFIRRSFMYYPHFASNLLGFARRFDQMPEILNIAGRDVASWYELALNYDLHAQAREREDLEFTPRGYNLGLNIHLSERLGFPQYSYKDGIKEMRRERT